MLLHHDFERCSATQPDAVALVRGDERLTYGDLARRARVLAALLQSRGVARGDRVALFLENGVEFVAGAIAVLQIGAVMMPINPLTKQDKLAYMLGDARPSALLAQDLLAPVW